MGSGTPPTGDLDGKVVPLHSRELPAPAGRRRRILVLAPRDPYPVIGGDRVRIYSIARELARHYDLTLLTFCRSERERNFPAPSDGVFKQVHRVVMPAWRSWLNVLAALPTREPLQVAYYRSEAFRAAVQRLAPSHDAVLAHLVRTAEYARDLPCVKVLEMTDAISMNMRRVAGTRLGYFDLRRWIYSIEARRLGEYERRTAAEFDLVSLTSRVDKRYLFRSPAVRTPNVIVVPNGVDALYKDLPSQRERAGAEIVFVGNLTTLQNFDAAYWFARRVMPLIRRRRPDAQFKIVGPIRPGSARKLMSLPGVRVLGVVERLPPVLASARVGVCPMRLGAGIQNKVLDYFSNRLAVVSSPMGVEGLEARHGVHLLVAESPDEWSAQVCALLDDPDAAQRVADAGRDLAESYYRWSERAQPLLSRLEHLLEHPERAPASAAEPVPSAVPALVETGL